MIEVTPDSPLHGLKVDEMVKQLQQKYGWEELARRINIQCFTKNPSIVSSAKFLRKTPWALERVQMLYLQMSGHKINVWPSKLPEKKPSE